MKFVIGIGCRKGTTCEEITDAVEKAMQTVGISFDDILGVATCDAKGNEPGLLDFLEDNDLSLETISEKELAEVEVPNPSDKPLQAVGTPSVAEAAAIIGANDGGLVLEKMKTDKVTVAIAKAKGVIMLVGIGPGSSRLFSLDTVAAISNAEAIVGYRKYLDLLPREAMNGKIVVSSGMTEEVDRCREAIKLAKEGNMVAVVSSGDPGVYGMAGLVMELLEEDDAWDDIIVDTIPGITAANAAASILGAPLMNDYAVVSLSDLMTPKETIKKRISAIADIDIACAIYNPRSKKRKELFDWTVAEFAAKRGGDQPCGLVANAFREGEYAWVGPLKDLPVARVDMSTLVIIGAANSIITKDGRLLTPRGYHANGPK